MREIKFKVWDEETKRMYSQKDVIVCFDNIGEDVYTKDDIPRALYDYKLMQYTGMKDADGKEVYEGDIIKIISENVITGWDDVGIIVYDEEYGSYCLEGFDGAYMDEYWDVNNLVIKADMYVIGNKYENKEILKEYDFDI